VPLGALRESLPNGGEQRQIQVVALRGRFHEAGVLCRQGEAK